METNFTGMGGGSNLLDSLPDIQQYFGSCKTVRLREGVSDILRTTPLVMEQQKLGLAATTPRSIPCLVQLWLDTSEQTPTK